MRIFSVNEILGIVRLQEAVAMGWRPSFLFFWGHRAGSLDLGKHILSQWWPAQFKVEEQVYPTAEHYMMSEKARLFGDNKMRTRILATTDPATAKALGRKVRGFRSAHWEAHCVEIVVRGNAAKFSQNPELGSWLRGTGDAVIVEASPIDAVWGIGLEANDPRAQDPSRWPGTNLLGFALMRVRAALGGDGLA
jgi:ribA/ribD-fused uncharacterized protein